MRVPAEKPLQPPFAVRRRPGLQDELLPGPAAPLSPNSTPTFALPGENSAPKHSRSEPAVSPADLYELGLTTAAMSYHTAAIEALRDCTKLAPNHAPAWRKLAELLRLAQEDAQADAAEAAARASATVKWKKGSDDRNLARLQQAERKLLEPLKPKPENESAMALREHLVAHPLDAAAMRWLARLETRSGDRATARALCKRALDLSPHYIAVREQYSEILIDQHDFEAIAQLRRLLVDVPGHRQYRFMLAHALMDNGKVDETIDVLTALLREDPHNAQYWLIHGNALRVSGRREEAIQAYRKCLDVQPEMGEAWLGMAELKDKVLTEDDIAEMRAQLDEHALPCDSRMAIFYALGQTLERAGDYAASFVAYQDGAREFFAIRETKPQENDAREDTQQRVQRLRAVFTRENLDSRLVQAPVVAPDVPIFVLGMPRAGSTLVEQILSSHSRVEGIGERPLISDIKRELTISRMLVTRHAYPDCLLDFPQDRLSALGAQVIAASRDYRATDRPYFVDKRPWNWLDVGLIHLILPQAKFIDVRREPMAACFAMYKQMLPRRSCEFSYDFKELGAYYNRYVGLMDHWQDVLPGRVHFIQYERLVADTEGEIRRMLDYCALPFEEGCLRFWEVDRAIVTPSAEQVRRPMYRHALEQWRNFEPWLGPLKDALAAPIET